MNKMYRCHPPFFSLLLLLLLLLHVLLGGGGVVVAAADQTPTRDHVVAASATATANHQNNNNNPIKKNCVLGQDGTCLDDEEQEPEDSNTQEQQQEEEDIPPPEQVVKNIPLPPVDEHYLMDVGYGEPQLVAGEHAAATKLRLQQMLHYFETVVNVDDEEEKDDTKNDHANTSSSTTTTKPFKFSTVIRQECQNRNPNCAFWAAIGECQANPAYMLLTCAAACMSCEQLDFHHRCPMPDNIQELNVWKGPGELENMFARIVAEYNNKNKDQVVVTILSRPGTFHDVTGEGAWVVQLDDFLTHEECDRLIELGTQRGYEQSKDVGERKFDGTYDSKEDGGRTSKNTWCLEECYDDPVTRGILQKIEDLTGIPDSHSEYLQLLRYEEGQFYNSHHDYIPHHIDRPSGPRILTVFLYLNTVEEGGGTYFNDLEITCQPKKGRAVIWPSVLDKAPNQKDHRTHHEALPVIKGVKYGANAWIHLRDFKTPYKHGCI